MEPCILSFQDKLLLSNGPSLSAGTDPESIGVQINLRLHLDEIADVEGAHLSARARRAPTDKERRKFADLIYRQRRLRDRVVEESLFGEPAWDMLLALYCFPARGEMLTVSSLSYAAAVPVTTGIRWQKVLTEQGLIETGPDEVDGRRRFVRLTSIGRAMMDRILGRLLEADPKAGNVTAEIQSVRAGSVAAGTGSPPEPFLISR